jgi:hypothetical protein
VHAADKQCAKGQTRGLPASYHAKRPFVRPNTLPAETATSMTINTPQSSALHYYTHVALLWQRAHECTQPRCSTHKPPHANPATHHTLVAQTLITQHTLHHVQATTPAASSCMRGSASTTDLCHLHLVQRGSQHTQAGRAWLSAPSRGRRPPSH